MIAAIAPEALDLSRLIRAGDTVVVGQGCGEPRALTGVLVQQRAAIGRARVFLGPGFAGSFRPEHADYLAFAGYAASGSNQALSRAGLLDILPGHYSALPALFTERRLAADVVLLLLGGAPGRFFLGMGIDYQIAAARRARTVIAEWNPHVPETPGSELPPDIRIDVLVRGEAEPAMLQPSPLGEVEAAIAGHVASLVPEGATLELGIGALPDAILASLTGHRDLGLHSGMVGDGVLALVEAGVLTNAKKPIDRGVSVGGLLFGTRRLFDFAHRSAALKLMPPAYTHGHEVLRQLPRFTAINSAIEADLTGQVNGESLGGVYLGAVGGQVDFLRGAAAASGGRSIIALPATAKGGTVSRIVGRLGDATVTSLRSDMDAIATEYGIAELRGLTLAERARRMIPLAAPQFREALERAAWRVG